MSIGPTAKSTIQLRQFIFFPASSTATKTYPL